MTEATGIHITFPDGTLHIISAAPDQIDGFMASLERGFGRLAHDGEHDHLHDHFVHAVIKVKPFDPTKVRADVWPDVVSYMKAVYDLDVDPDQDEADEWFDSFTWELVSPPEPFNTPHTERDHATGEYRVTCRPVIAFTLQRGRDDGKLWLGMKPEALTPAGHTDGHFAHRPTENCHEQWTTEPTCKHAVLALAEYSGWVAKQRAMNGLEP